MDEEYVRPTNFELVQMAEAIVVATAVQETRNENPFYFTVTFRVDEALKGAPPKTLSLPSSLFGDVEPSDLNNLASSHPEGHGGPCNRMTFRAGAQYLLFVQEFENGTWARIGHAFSRVSEDYRGEDNSWMRSVRRYLAMQREHDPLAQLVALEDMLKSGKGLKGEKLDSAERQDIADHLRSFSPYKPTEVLLAAYNQLEHGVAPAHGVRSPVADRENSAADAIAREILGQPSREDEKWTALEQRLFILQSLVNGDHPGAMDLFRRLIKEDSDPAAIGLALRFLARHGAYAEAYDWISRELLVRLPKLPRKDQERLVSDVAELQLGDGSDNPPWKHDPRAAAEWPELALKLYTWQVKAWRADNAYPFDDAISAIQITDYRSRPDLTLALARGYDSDVRDWAIRELLKPLPAGASSHLDLPLRAILTAWQSENYGVVEQIYCRGGRTRLRLIELLGTDAAETYESSLLRIAASPGSPAERKAIRKAHVEWKRRFKESPSPGYHIEGDKYVRNVPTPITCKVT